VSACSRVMRTRFCATMRRPACSIIALIAPVRLRAVASGLMIENVRSIAIGKVLLGEKALSGRKFCCVAAAYIGRPRTRQASDERLMNAPAGPVQGPVEVPLGEHGNWQNPSK